MVIKLVRENAVLIGVALLSAAVFVGAKVAYDTEVRSFTFFPEEAEIAEPVPLLKEAEFIRWAQADLEWKQNATAKIIAIELACRVQPTPPKKKLGR